MKKIKCVIADDEQLSREILESYFSRVSHLQLIAACKNGTEVFNILKQQTIDLIFLDIQMPQLTGIELLKLLNKPPAIIFTTAYRDYALEAFELNVLDYLLKPISFERFLKAIDKYESGVSSFPENKTESNIIHTGNLADFINIKSGKKIIRILLNDILFIEGMKDYVKIKTTHTELLTYQTLAEFEQQLSPEQFLRIHRSFIISLSKIKSFNASAIDVAGNELHI